MAPEGWLVLDIDSTAGSRPGSGQLGSDATPRILRTPAAVDHTDYHVMGVAHAIDLLKEPVAFAVRLRDGTLTHFQSLDNNSVDPEGSLGRDSFR